LDAPSFLLLGETGEGDISQYIPMSVIESVAPDTDSMIICSDVIYPAGGIVEYAYKPSWPYRNYPRPVYALPGNHDWYDSLRGFMTYFCGRPQRRVLLTGKPIYVNGDHHPCPIDGRRRGCVDDIISRPCQQGALARRG
jgi:hypothetical protein